MIRSCFGSQCPIIVVLVWDLWFVRVFWNRELSGQEIRKKARLKLSGTGGGNRIVGRIYLLVVGILMRSSNPRIARKRSLKRCGENLLWICSTQRRRRIAACRRLHQSVQVPQQRRIFDHQLLAPTTRGANPARPTSQRLTADGCRQISLHHCAHAAQPLSCALTDTAALTSLRIAFAQGSQRRLKFLSSCFSSSPT